MSSKVEVSVKRLCDYIKDNIFTATHPYYDQVLVCTGYSVKDGDEDYTEEDEEFEEVSKKLICTFDIEMSEAKFAEFEETYTDSHGNVRHKRDQRNYTIKKGTTKEYHLDIALPKDDFGVITTENGSKRTSINSAYYIPAIKFTKNSIFLQSEANGKKDKPRITFKINEQDDTGKKHVPAEMFEITDFETGKLRVTRIPFKAIFRHYGLDKSSKYLNALGISGGYDQFMKVDIAEDELDLDPKIIKQIESFKVNSKALLKLKIISKQEFKPTSEYFDANLCDFILSRFYKDIDDHEILNKTQTRFCDAYNLQTPLDYQFMDALDAVRYDLEKERYTILGKMYWQYNRNNRAGVRGEIFNSTVVQNIIDKFFHMQTKFFHDVQTTTDSNTLSILSQKNTIYFYSADNKDGELQKVKVFNKSFMGLTDPNKTPETGKLVNAKNELAFGTHIDENGELSITVINIKTGREEQINYEEFSTEPLLALECYDSATKTPIVSPITGKYEVSQYWDFNHLDELPKGIKYAVDRKMPLSYSAAMIPFAGRMVSGRTALASRFLDQSIPVAGAKPPVVYTPMAKELYKHNPSNEVYNLKESGTVVDVADQYVKVKTTSGKTKVFGKDLYSKNPTTSTTNFYVPQVKKGDKVKAGDILISSNSFVDGEFTTQVPLFVMFGTYMGHEHEDGIVITESAAKLFAHKTIYEKSEDFSANSYWGFKRNDWKDSTVKISKETPIKLRGKKNSAIEKMVKPTIEELEKNDINNRKENLDEWSLIKPGSLVKAGSLLFECWQYNRDEVRGPFYSEYLKMANDVDEAQQVNLKKLTRVLYQARVPYDVRGNGTVIDVNLVINDDKSLLDEGTIIPNNVEFETVQKIHKKEITLPNSLGINTPDTDNKTAFKYFKKIGEERAATIAKHSGKKNTGVWKISDENNAFELRITIKYWDEMSTERLGGKLSNLYASKGVNVHIIPDKFAPETDIKDGDGKPIKVDAIIGLGTTFSRQNPGQYDDVKLGLIGKMTWERMIKGHSSPTAKTKKFLDNLYPPVNGKSSWDWNKLKFEGERYGYCRIPMEYFDRYYNHDKVIELLGILGLENGETYVTFPEFGKLKTQYKCTVGVTSMSRLHFIQQHKAKITPTGNIGITDDDNITYTDMDKAGGQKMGQMEVHAAWAHGLFDTIRHIAVEDPTKPSKGAYLGSKLISLGLSLRSARVK